MLLLTMLIMIILVTIHMVLFQALDVLTILNEYLLKQLDIKIIYDQINGVNNKNKECFCQLPLMMGSSKFQLGALNSQKKIVGRN